MSRRIFGLINEAGTGEEKILHERNMTDYILHLLSNNF
jgi:hypothetical protein